MSERPVRITHDPLPSLRLEAVLFRQGVSDVIKYVASGVAPLVHVSAQQDRWTRTWTLRFADNGFGTPPKSQKRVFEVVHREATDYPGTGIGLATCRRIGERHGGRIRIKDGEGGGTVVSTTLPPDCHS